MVLVENHTVNIKMLKWDIKFNIHAITQTFQPDNSLKSMIFKSWSQPSSWAAAQNTNHIYEQWWAMHNYEWGPRYDLTIKSMLFDNNSVLHTNTKVKHTMQMYKLYDIEHHGSHQVLKAEICPTGLSLSERDVSVIISHR